EGRDAGGFGQGAQPIGSVWAWEGAGPAFADARADLIQAPGPVHRLAVTRYRVGELLTGSNARLKLAAMRNRLLLQAEPTSVLILSSEDDVTGASIRTFEQALGDVPAWMDRIGQER
ncbi:MAG: exosortase A, partial [Proteobacteria bacterium]|nr:exosortase A [Pseudomonadota bacterium]